MKSIKGFHLKGLFSYFQIIYNLTAQFIYHLKEVVFLRCFIVVIKSLA